MATSDSSRSGIECHSPCYGAAYRVRSTEYFACRKCGRVGKESEIVETSTGTKLFVGGSEDSVIRFAGIVRLPIDSFHMGPWVLVKSPYGAKDVLKDLPEEITGRRWCEQLSSWVIKESSLELALSELRKTDWTVVDLVNARGVE